MPEAPLNVKIANQSSWPRSSRDAARSDGQELLHQLELGRWSGAKTTLTGIPFKSIVAGTSPRRPRPNCPASIRLNSPMYSRQTLGSWKTKRLFRLSCVS